MELHYTLVLPMARNARWFIAASVPLSVACGVLGLVGRVPGPVALVLIVVLLLGGVGLPLLAKARKHSVSTRGYAQHLARQVGELGEALGKYPFDPDADGVTPEMRLLHEKALKAYRAAAGTPVNMHNTSSVSTLLDRSHAAIRELDIQYFGRPVLEFALYDSPERVPISKAPQKSKSLGPLKEFRGTGNKLIRVPSDLPERAVFELKNEGPGRTSFSTRRWPFGTDRHWGTARFDEVIRDVIEHPWYHRQRYLRIASDTEWVLSYLEYTGVPQFESAARGEGSDVLLYSGGPCVVEFANPPGPGVRVEELDGDLRHLRTLGSGDRPSFALAGPALLRVGTHRPWSLDVRPATGEELPLRSFSTAIEGYGCEPIRFSGQTSQAIVQSHGKGIFDLHLLGPDLGHEATLVSGSLNERLGMEIQSIFLLKEGSILQVETATGNWGIRTISAEEAALRFPRLDRPHRGMKGARHP